MNEERLSTFLRIAESITVVDIATPIRRHVSPHEDQVNVFEMLSGMEYAEDQYALVCDQERVYGYLALEDAFGYQDPDPGPVLDKAIPIPLEKTVSFSTPLLHLMPMFGDQGMLFVLTGNQITHIVNYNRDVDRLAMKLWLFSLILELESRMTELLESEPNLDECLERLSATRLQKIRKLCNEKHRDELPWQMLRSANFIDKVELIRQIPHVYDNLPFFDANHPPSGRRFDSVFSRIERVRNQIAHSDSIFGLVPSPRALNDFVQTLRALVVLVDEATARRVRRLPENE